MIGAFLMFHAVGAAIAIIIVAIIFGWHGSDTVACVAMGYVPMMAISAVQFFRS